MNVTYKLLSQSRTTEGSRTLDTLELREEFATLPIDSPRFFEHLQLEPFICLGSRRVMCKMDFFVYAQNSSFVDESRYW